MQRESSKRITSSKIHLCKEKEDEAMWDSASTRCLGFTIFAWLINRGLNISISGMLYTLFKALYGVKLYRPKGSSSAIIVWLSLLSLDLQLVYKECVFCIEIKQKCLVLH